MTTLQNQVVVEATIAEREWTAALGGAVAEEIADCFSAVNHALWSGRWPRRC
ncbi:hypothetical protein AB0D11_44750 [Streptomyces monashensis]|uniref:hypothetical protein n=1 Tax=Streptomyces monashensis TaxID=1678012 RepID=UPI0034094B88